MATKQNIPKNPLGDYAEMGYHFKGKDGDVAVTLCFKDFPIGDFNQTRITEEEVQKTCREHWDRLIMSEAY